MVSIQILVNDELSAAIVLSTVRELLVFVVVTWVGEGMVQKPR